jgi:hypothetical protein
MLIVSPELNVVVEEGGLLPVIGQRKKALHFSAANATSTKTVTGQERSMIAMHLTEPNFLR